MKSLYIKSIMLLLVALMFFGEALAQVSGKVTSEEDPNGLLGVTVVVQGKQVGSITDAEGNYEIEAAQGEVLVFSYIGMVSQEITVNGSEINVQLRPDESMLSEIIITATNKPVRKLETTTAVSVINQQIMEQIRPEGFSEAIQGTPGVYTSQSQGRFRGSVFIRGFPDGSGNGLVYTGILIDGLPSLATPARPPDFAFGMDPNVDRIEVVRGSAATLFGRASAAGVVNVITKVGDDKLNGMVRITNYNGNVTNRDGLDMKLEGNINGPITKNLRFNVGGYYVNDRGFRDMGYNDRGGQVRANLDYLFGDQGSKGSLRLFGGYTNITIQNMIDIPYRYSDNTPREGWTTYDSYYSTTLDNYTSPLNGFLGIPEGHFQITDRNGDTQFRSFQAANEDGNYARGGNIGLMFDYQLTDWLRVSNKFRYQSYNHGTKFNLGVSTFYFNDPNDANRLINFRILIDGDGRDADMMDELRFTIPLNNHNISVGTYFSSGRYTPETYSWFHVSDANPTDPNLGFFGDLLDPNGNPILLPDSSTISVPTTVNARPLPFGSAARRDEYHIVVNSFFVGDEMKIGDALTINAGLRFDRVMMDIQGFYNDPADVSRMEEHSDFSGSLGINYLLNQRSSVYGNFVRAFRMPDYSAYTPADPNSLVDNPDITDNEIVINTEVGYRTGIGDLGIDAAAFYTLIQNRLATIYEGAVATLKPLGTNQIVGGELALTYAPSGVKGLLIRSSFTYQNATFQEFLIPVSASDPTGESYGNTFVLQGQDTDGNDVYSIDLKGNQVPRVPSTIFNLMANYDSDYFGANIALNYFGNRYADATNIFKQDDITNINVGLYGKYDLANKNRIKLTFLVKNALNTDRALRFLYVSDNDALLARQQLIDSGGATADNTFYTGIPYLPRRILISVSYEFK